jgi:hypothetical protein
MRKREAPALQGYLELAEPVTAVQDEGDDVGGVG